MSTIALSEFDNVTAAGILARTALSLSDADNPAAQFKVPNERQVRAEVLEHLSQLLGIHLQEPTASDIEKLEEALDRESDLLLEPINEKKILEELSVKGELPSDLYEVSIESELSSFFGKNRFNEEVLIKSTVQSPDRVEHLLLGDDETGSDESGDAPLLSLFAKSFENRFPNKNFTMLVTGLRQGLCFHVQQAWRIYSDFISKPSRTLLDLLRRFAEEYGIEMEINNRRGKFFLNAGVASGEVSRDITLKFSGQAFFLAQFDKRERKSGKLMASLVYAIDLGRYRKKLLSHGWNDEKLNEWCYPVGKWRKDLVSAAPRRLLAS